jgi:hypothetical protein
MDQNQKHPQGTQIGSTAHRPQQSKPWDGHERRMGAPDRRQNSGVERQNRNTAADMRMMNEGSSR